MSTQTDSTGKQDTPLRFGILGAARIAPNALIKPARVVGGVAVRAVAARDGARATEFARKHAIPQAYGSYDALIDDPTIDAVYVALPNSLHCEWAIRAMQAGKHVLCEKPLASNADEAEAMRTVAESSGVLFVEAFHNLYHPLLLKMREVVRSGVLGRVERVQGVFNTTIRRKQDIRFEYALGGGAMMDLGCYLVSMTRFVLDAGSPGMEEPRVVTAHAEMLGEKVDGAMHTLLHLSARGEEKVEVELECAMRRWQLPELNFRVTGTQGEMYVINPILPQVWHRLTLRTKEGKRSIRVERDPTYSCQLEAFAQAIRSGEPMPTDAEQGVRNMRVIDAVYRAAGLPVRGLGFRG